MSHFTEEENEGGPSSQGFLLDYTVPVKTDGNYNQESSNTITRRMARAPLNFLSENSLENNKDKGNGGVHSFSMKVPNLNMQHCKGVNTRKEEAGGTQGWG